MKYKLAEVIAFGERLIETEDLDPIYCAIVRAQLPEKQIKRLLLAYFCFYHLGVSAYISEYEGHEFWEVAEQAAENVISPNDTDPLIKHDGWPRGTERRHFRGQKCVDALESLEKGNLFGSGTLARDCPEGLIDTLTDGYDKPPYYLSLVMTRIQDWPMFGPWIAFKAADMLERILGTPIVFSNDITMFYKEPRAALDMLELPAEESNERLLKHFKKFPAPPCYKTACGVQECETILCKWKSYKSKHYRIGKDIHEVRLGLKGWGRTAEKLLKVTPKEVDWGQLFV